MLEVQTDRRLRNQRVKGSKDPALPVLRPNQGTKIVRFAFWHGRQLSDLPDKVLDMYLKQGEGYTALLNGEPIAACGVMLTGTGLGSAWGLITDKARQMPVLLHRNVSRVLRNIIARHELRRVDMVVHCENEAAINWAVRLGFEYEGRMKNFYADGKSAFFMARCGGR